MMKNTRSTVLNDPSHTLPTALVIPDWAQPNPVTGNLDSAVFSSAISLKTLDDLTRSNPLWVGCWRNRQALLCAANACRWLRINADASDLRDAVLLCGQGANPGPGGKILLSYQGLSRASGPMNSAIIPSLAAILGIELPDDTRTYMEAYAAALQTSRPPPLAAAGLIQTLYRISPEAEVLGWILADGVIATKLGWCQPLPLLISARFSPLIQQTKQGRGRILPDDLSFERAICLAIVEATQNALNSANAIARHSAILQLVAPKLRNKSATLVIRNLLAKDSLLATAPGCDLSRWAATRLFARLESFGAIRELSGRSTFKIYGL